MHHYTTTLDHLGVRESILPLWRHYIPQEAIKHSFLMHGLLALAAIHLAHLKPGSSSRYLQACDKHQAIALETFRSILLSPFDTELADALFAFSGVLPVSSMARSCTPSESATLDMNAVTELFMLTRGVKHVLQLSRDHIKDGPLGAMLEIQPYPDDAGVQLPHSISSSFESIRQMLNTYGMDEESLYARLKGETVSANCLGIGFAGRSLNSIISPLVLRHC